MMLLALGTTFVVAAGCSGGSHGSSFFGASTAASTSAGSTVIPATSAYVGSRVVLTQRGLMVNGQTKVLIGGDVQYYRVRDPNFNVANTWALWGQALDQLQAAGGNLVSTYVPWDYHEATPGQLDFTGVRDLDHFLELCWNRGLYVDLKPGPFINSEWPYGVGYFGAVPQWWKTQHPDALALGPNGQPFSFALLGGPSGYQPSFFSPDFQQAAVRWFTILAPIVQKYVFQRPTIVLLQIDNEDNFYFKSRFSSDYSQWGQAQYASWLANKYGSIAAVSTAPPTQAGNNQQVQDWFDAGWDGIAAYQALLRSTWESLGIQEPNVLFTTNDSPHAMPTMDLLLWDADTKSRAGVPSIDAYPKQFPWTFDKPLDYPFLTSFFTKRFMAATGTKGAFAAELQGGMFDLPGQIELNIPEASTDHVFLEFYGHGGVVGSIYTFHGGLNLDNTRYFEMAPVDQFGNPTPRYQVFKKYAQNLAADPDLLASSDVEAPVALVVASKLCAPISGIPGHPGWLQAKEAPAVLGWLEDAGVEPVILEGSKVQPGDLSAYKLVIYVDPDAAEDTLAQALDDYVQQGGVLVNLLGRGENDPSWNPSTLLPGGLFSDGTFTGSYVPDPTLDETVGPVFPPNINFALPGGGPSGTIATSPFLGYYDVASTADVIAWDSTAPFGVNGNPSGWRATKGAGEVIFLATNPAASFRDSGYYEAASSEILGARALGRWILGEAGVNPVLEVDNGDAQAFARQGPALVFVASRMPQAGNVVVRVLDLPSLGLDAGTTYTVTDVLDGTALGTATGATLQQTGFTLSMAAYGSAVVSIK
jgi:hypothetical protein